MKKFFAAALVVSMLTVLLSGCMCQVADTTFQFDGSGTVEAKFGFSEEMVNAMNMRAEMTQNGFSYFRYNGHSYYGDQASESFANADEFNAIFAEVSAEISEVSKAATPGKVTLSVADDGGLTLTVQNDQNDRRAAIKKALAAELPDYSDAQIDALCSRADDAEMASTTTHAAELAELSAEENTLLQRCTSLTPEDRVFLARRPDRPHITEMIDNLFTDFFEQCGDRQCKEDAAILCGIARFHGMPVTVLGHRKGTTLEENLRCNFGMPGPEGYRKALRVMKQAEKFHRPIITFIDTPGAYPGKDAEERGQGEAIARNLMEMSGLTVPVLAIVTGEGSSGGALGLGVANHILMLENAVYSVLSPEGFASILWKDASRSGEACTMMKLTAQDLYADGIVEEVIPEPLGGAQRGRQLLFSRLDTAIAVHLAALCKMSGKALAEQRYKKYRRIGEMRGA